MADNFDKIRGTEEAALNDRMRQFLTFAVDREEYGVDIMTVREIKGWTETTRLPNASEYMRGVMNLRGLIIPIFDMRMRLHLGLTDATPKHVVIILAVGERNIGILVDAVSDILDVSSEQIKPAPAEAESVATHDTTSHDGAPRVDAAFINGLISLNDRMVVLLNVDHLFDRRQIDQAAPDAA